MIYICCSLWSLEGRLGNEDGGTVHGKVSDVEAESWNFTRVLQEGNDAFTKANLKLDTEDLMPHILVKQIFCIT